MLLRSVPAQAHLNSTGLGPVYDGIAHFLTRPEDLLCALALALLAGLRGASQARGALFALPSAWLLGGLLGSTAEATGSDAVAASLWLALLGGLLAADAKLPRRTTIALAAGAGLHHGYLNAAGTSASWSAAAALLGLTAAVFTVVALASAFAARMRAAWARLAMRIVGSWIAAVGLLTLAWAWRAG